MLEMKDWNTCSGYLRQSYGVDIVRMREVLASTKVDVRVSQVCLSYRHQKSYG